MIIKFKIKDGKTFKNDEFIKSESGDDLNLTKNLNIENLKTLDINLN